MYLMYVNMKLVVLLVCIGSLQQLAHSLATKGTESQKDKNCEQGKKTDIAGGYILSQQNVAGFCLAKSKSRYPCQEQSSETWLIHGLWPTLDSNGRSGICYCTNESYVASNVQGIPNIDKYWFDLLESDSNEFWGHEWETHGTCAINSTGSMSQRQYFTQTVDLYAKYNFTDILQRYYITPSNTVPYSLFDIVFAFKMEFNVFPAVTYLTRQDKTSYIFAMHLCMDSNFTLTSCFINDTKDIFDGKEVYYLENPFK